MDNLSGVRTLIEKMDIPPRTRLLIDKMEQELGPIEKPPAEGIEEVKRLRNYIDGDNLIGCILAHFLNQVPLPDKPEPAPDPDADDDDDEQDTDT